MSNLHSPLKRFGWLLRRELWEHRIGMVWSPLIAGAISLLLAGIALMAAVLSIRAKSAQGQLQVEGQAIQINGLDLAELTGKLDAEQLANLGAALNSSLLVSSTWPLMVLSFVMFFYCAGALYDDRRDRSILFWKSLPVSDLSTVLSKALTALVVAPVLAIGAAIATLIGFVILLSLAVLALGGSPMQLILGPASPLSVIGTLIGWLPVYAVWALPTVGWLLLCSALLPRVPFLLAILIPVLTGALLSISGLAGLLGLSHSSIWGGVIARLLSGTLPGIHLVWQQNGISGELLEQWMQSPSPLPAYGVFSLPTTWIGAAIGLVLIAVAIIIRRRSDDS